MIGIEQALSPDPQTPQSNRTLMLLVRDMNAWVATISRSTPAYAVAILTLLLLAFAAEGLSQARERTAPKSRSWEEVPTQVVTARDYASFVELDNRGDYLAVVNGFDRGGLDVWSIRERAWVLHLDESQAEMTSPILMMGQPCMGLAMGWSGEATLFRCDGSQVWSLPLPRNLQAHDHYVNNIRSVAGVEDCGLAVAKLSVGAIVVDLRRRSIREDLGKLFPEGDGVLGAATDAKRCVVYAATGALAHSLANRNSPQMDQGVVFEVDLAAGSSRVLAPPAGRGDWQVNETLFDFRVSPSGKRAALFVCRVKKKGGSPKDFQELFDMDRGLQYAPLTQDVAPARNPSVWLSDNELFYFGAKSPMLVDIDAWRHRALRFPRRASAFGRGPIRWSSSPRARRLAVLDGKTIYLYDVPPKAN